MTHPDQAPGPQERPDNPPDASHPQDPPTAEAPHGRQQAEPSRQQAGPAGRPPQSSTNPGPLPPDRGRGAHPAPLTPGPQGYAPGAQGYAPGPPPQAPPAKERGGFARGFGIGTGAGLGFVGTLLVLSLLGTLLTTLMMMGAASAFAGANQTAIESTKTLWGPDGATKKLRAINVNGVIMADSGEGGALSTGTYGYEVAQVIDKLKPEDADGIILLMNTPGGSVNGSRAMADAVERYKKRTGKKAVAYVQGMSASGGMYTMANADKIIADHGSLVGSIGIIMGPFEQYKNVTATSGTLLTPGVTTTGGITSEYLTQGKGKDFGNPYRPISAEERQNYTAGLANEYANFVNWVSQHRKIPAATIRNTYGAFMFDTKRAQENKLIDATMGRDEAFRDFAGFAGLDPNDTKVVVASAPPMWTSLLGAQSRVYGEAPPVRPEGGQPARVTNSLCVGAPAPIAYAGDLHQVCG
ncbi:S49 family peptidase [Nigerium massiliense]|uniref:S49 family peptidase n=1 Tax=Nigerium massiliense TaxID=1522317 RepID=UPI000694ABB8|nr:S49 family peptidase [Nigerium massiliense]